MCDPRLHKIPAKIFGCSVLTRPPIISSYSVYSDTSVDSMPESLSKRFVFFVARIRKPFSTKKRANSTTPSLSVTDKRATFVFCISIALSTIYSSLPRSAPQSPGHLLHKHDSQTYSCYHVYDTHLISTLKHPPALRPCEI
ncbi:hypothetical protein ANAPRD1_01341 [Anaplasma phagocytophilum]|nr:hypothetical protein ANAPH1_00784 [Anaplasma phagocytophilum]SCV66824.1 hypothetical protein ANAPRD1_01341 [Anaplasma phagocytophilum]